MPLDVNGNYFENNEKVYEYEASYYLDFQIFSALLSLQFLETNCDESIWENKYQYYHFYTDHLLFTLGQISNRFLTENDDELIQSRKEKNCINYSFSKDKYPIISNKWPRNVVVHIDERDQRIIFEKGGVGGFCVIDSEVTSELEYTLRNKRNTQPYTLDLVNKKLLVRDRKNNITVNLIELKNELLSLQNSVKSFMQAMEKPYMKID